MKDKAMVAAIVRRRLVLEVPGGELFGGQLEPTLCEEGGREGS